MAQKIVTLYLDDTSIRLLVTHGKRIKKWADLPLESGLVKNGVVLKEAEVAAKIKQLFEVRKVKAKKVIIGVSGFHCLTRPILLPQLPNEMLEEAVRREAKRLLPVPPEQLYLSWERIPAPEGKTQAFLVAVPRKTADALLQMLRQVGLKPELMDLKPLLLARAVREGTAIIVDVQSTEFDIVIIANGVPQPIRTMPLPSEAKSWQEKQQTIRNELNRTIEFYNSNNPEKPLVSTVPIFASGALAGESELCQSLSEELGHPVLPLPPSLEYPEGLDQNRYLANMGLVLKKLAAAKEPATLVTNLNVLPTVYQPKSISLTRILALPGAAVVICSLAFLAIIIQSAFADVSSTRGQLVATEELIQSKTVERQELGAKVAELETKIAEAETAGGNFNAAVTSLEKQRKRIDGITVTVNSLPDSVSLTSISYVSGILTINGIAPSEEEALSYLRELDASGRFSNITVASMKRAEGEGMYFTLVLGPGE